MATTTKNGVSPNAKRYSKEMKDRAVRMVFAVREETGESYGTVRRVAEQLGMGVETLRKAVAQAEIDQGMRAGSSTADKARIKELEQRNRELERSNEILKRAATFFGAELDRQHK